LICQARKPFRPAGSTSQAANAAGLIDDALAAAHPDGRPRIPPTAVTTGQVPGGHACTRTRYQDPAGAALAELIRFFDEHPAVPPMP